MSQWVFLFEIAGLKIPEKKGFLHCKLYFTVSSFKHNSWAPPPPFPPTPIQIAYTLSWIGGSFGHWFWIRRRESLREHRYIIFLWSFWFIFHDFLNRSIFQLYAFPSSVSRAINVIDILGIVLENCMQHLLLLIKTKFQRAMIDQLRALIGRQLCSEV